MKRPLRPFVVEVKRTRKPAASSWDPLALLAEQGADAGGAAAEAEALFRDLGTTPAGKAAPADKRSTPVEQAAPVVEDAREPQVLPSLLQEEEAGAPAEDAPKPPRRRRASQPQAGKVPGEEVTAPVVTAPVVTASAAPAPAEKPRTVRRKRSNDADRPDLFAAAEAAPASRDAVAARETAPAAVQPRPSEEPAGPVGRPERKKVPVRRLRELRTGFAPGQRWRRRLPALIR